MDNLLIILSLCGFIIWILFNIFITSLCFYGAMFAKWVWLRFLCVLIIVISAGSIISIGRIIEAIGQKFQKDFGITIIDFYSSRILSPIILIFTIAIMYYIACRLALFYKARKEYTNNKAGILKYQGLFQILI